MGRRHLNPKLRKGRPTMEKDSTDQAKAPQTGSIKIEWNWDLEESMDLGDFRPSDTARATLKGRCKRCWGRLLGRVDDMHVLTGIRCRVCGALVQGKDAKAEYERMSHESALNMLNMGLGHAPRYKEDSKFVQKVFPETTRQTEEQFLERVDAKRSAGTKRGWLTRTSFPAGSVGYFLLQARVLISGVERTPREMSVAQFSDFDLNYDGSATVYLSKKELSEHSTTHEYELMKRMGSVVTIAMMSAFACELAMKAICLARLHEARKSHDLLSLFDGLPADSRERIEADFSEITTVLERGRHTFGDWRYFETTVSERGFAALIDTERALALGKAARVILDEAEMVGLGYSIRLEAKQSARADGDERTYQYHHHLHVVGRESPPQ